MQTVFSIGICDMMSCLHRTVRLSILFIVHCCTCGRRLHLISMSVICSLYWYEGSILLVFLYYVNLLPFIIPAIPVTIRGSVRRCTGVAVWKVVVYVLPAYRSRYRDEFVNIGGYCCHLYRLLLLFVHFF